MRVIRNITVLLVMICLVLSGCGLRVLEGDENADLVWLAGSGGIHASYFNRYSLEQEEDRCKVKGTLYQAAADDESTVMYVTAGDDGGIVNVTGSMRCTRGNLRLVYMAPDGVETLLAEGTDRKIDVQADVLSGEGSIGFVGDGEAAVCDFGIRMTAGDGVTFTSIMERDRMENMEEIEEPEGFEEIRDMEEIEEPEGFEEIRDMEEMEEPEGFEEIGDMEEIEEPEMMEESEGLKEIENNWPERIFYHSNGSWGNPMRTDFEAACPMTLSISCMTREGKLRLRIVRRSALGEAAGETVYFDETNPDGDYTVELDTKGQYQLLFYAKEHVGSVKIVPMEE